MDEPRLGDLLVRDGLVSEAQVREALRVQEGLEQYQPIGQILVSHKLITRKQLDTILDRYRKRPRLGAILLKSKAITQEHLQAALSHPRSGRVRLGELLIQLGFTTETQIRQALCTQLNVPFVDLESFAPGPVLARWIKKAYAYRHRVVAVARFVDNLTVAMDDPTDVAVIRELEYSTGCALNVVTSTAASIRRALRAVYGDEPAPSAGGRRRISPS